MKKKLIIFIILWVAIFALNVVTILLDMRINAQKKQIKECEINIKDLTNDVNELKRIQENLSDNLSNLSDEIESKDIEISSLTDALEKATEEVTTEESTTEEGATEEPTTEKKQDKEPVKQNTTESGTETNTEVNTETAPDNVKAATTADNVWGITVTDTDISYLQRMAETETRGADMMSKTHVISVAMNRAKTYGQSPYAVITSPNQFAYGNTAISQSTIDAVNYILQNGDTAQGALFFHSGGYSATFCGRPCIFGDDVGHYFY